MTIVELFAVAAAITAIVSALGAGFASHYAVKSGLNGARTQIASTDVRCARIENKLDASTTRIEDKLDRGQRKMASHDTRIAVLEAHLWHQRPDKPESPDT